MKHAFRDLFPGVYRKFEFVLDIADFADGGLREKNQNEVC